MMQEITPYNFDEFLFEYFEGTLNEVDKKKFLAFIEQIPSYKKDMELWGQSIVASDNIDVPEGLENLFTRKESFWKSSKGKWTMGVVAVGIIAGSVALYNLKETTSTTPTLPKPEQTEMKALQKNEQNNTQQYFNSTNDKIEKTASATIRSANDNNKIPTTSFIGKANQEEIKDVPHLSIEKDTTQQNFSNTDGVIGNAEIVTPSDGPKKPVDQPEIEIEKKKKNLGKPKNIIDMRNNLEEN
ncbi:MAG: hypothetical protein ACO3EE_03770 [Flavobacteriales bacterium]